MRSLLKKQEKYLLDIRIKTFESFYALYLWRKILFCWLSRTLKRSCGIRINYYQWKIILVHFSFML